MNKAFVLYTEYSQKFRRLTDEQLGKLLRVIFQYEETGEVPEIEDQFVAFAFDIIQPDLEKQYEKYQAKVAAGKRSGEQRKRTQQNDSEQTEAEMNTPEQKGTNVNTDEQNEQNDDLLPDVQPVQVCCPNKKEKENKKENKKEKEILRKEIKKEKKSTEQNVEVLYPQIEERSIYAPQLIDVREFCALKGLTISPEAFFHHYESVNWQIGGTPIYDWKSKAMSWEADEKQKQNQRRNTNGGTGSRFADVYRREFGDG